MNQLQKHTNNNTLIVPSLSDNKFNKILLAGLKNLKQALNNLSLEQFTLSTLEALMYLEREEYLTELKNNGGRDKGNGHYERSIKSLSRNSLSIKIPRTRHTEFKPFVLEILKYNQEQINELALKLYSCGVTTRDTSKILKDFFGENMSYSKVSNLAEQFNELRKAWEGSKLESSYKVIFCDAIYISMRRGNSYSKEPVHIAYGVREDNKRELLHLSVNPTESSTSWGACFKNIKERGVKNVNLIVADGLKNLENEVHKYFPGTLFQKCVVHKMRNILCKIRPKDKKEVTSDLQSLFKHFHHDSSIEDTKNSLNKFLNKWGKLYPGVSRLLKNDTMEYYFTYLKLPSEIRKMIYTTNSIESLNKRIRKATRNKQSFEKPERLLDYVFMVIKDFEAENWMQYPVAAFGNWTHKTHPN